MKTYNEFTKDLNKTNVDRAIRHDWATHIYHPNLGEVKVESHSLTEDGIIEEIFNDIGINNKIFCEIGIGNCIENNTCSNKII